MRARPNLCLSTQYAHLGEGDVAVGAAAAGRVVGGVGAVRVLEIDLPRRSRVEALVGGVTPPQALDEHGSCRNLPVEVFLALLLLNFEGKARAEDPLQREENRWSRVYARNKKYRSVAVRVLLSNNNHI